MGERVVYWLCGTRYAETLAVSMATLREHYSGPITLCHDPDEQHAEVAARLDSLFQVTPCPFPKLNIPRHRHYVTKAMLWKRLPVGPTVLLDADTVVCKPIGALFGEGVTLTEWCGWVTTGPKISKRLRALREHCDPALHPYIAQQLAAPFPAINTGVVGWGPAAVPFLGDWSEHSARAARAPLTDELVAQALSTGPGVDIVRHVWNCSPTYGQYADPAIWHFHGRRHVRREDGRAIWQPHARRALERHPELRAWWGQYDPAVANVAE